MKPASTKLGILNNQGVLAGLLFIALGGFAFVIALGYKFGSTIDMGPGYFPRALGLLLTGFGVVTVIRGLRQRIDVDGGWSIRPLAILTCAVLAFGFLVERLGFVPAVAALVFIAALAGSEFRFREVVVLTGVLTLLAVSIFIWGLRLPYRLFVWNI